MANKFPRYLTYSNQYPQLPLTYKDHAGYRSMLTNALRVEKISFTESASLIGLGDSSTGKVIVASEDSSSATTTIGFFPTFDINAYDSENGNRVIICNHIQKPIRFYTTYPSTWIEIPPNAVYYLYMLDDTAEWAYVPFEQDIENYVNQVIENYEFTGEQFVFRIKDNIILPSNTSQIVMIQSSDRSIKDPLSSSKGGPNVRHIYLPTNPSAVDDVVNRENVVTIANNSNAPAQIERLGFIPPLFGSGSGGGLSSYARNLFFSGEATPFGTKINYSISVGYGGTMQPQSSDVITAGFQLKFKKNGSYLSSVADIKNEEHSGVNHSIRLDATDRIVDDQYCCKGSFYINEDIDEIVFEHHFLKSDEVAWPDTVATTAGHRAFNIDQGTNYISLIDEYYIQEVPSQWTTGYAVNSFPVVGSTRTSIPDKIDCDFCSKSQMQSDAAASSNYGLLRVACGSAVSSFDFSIAIPGYDSSHSLYNKDIYMRMLPEWSPLRNAGVGTPSPTEWEYSLDNGSTWSDLLYPTVLTTTTDVIPTWHNLGTLNELYGFSASDDLPCGTVLFRYGSATWPGNTNPDTFFLPIEVCCGGSLTSATKCIVVRKTDHQSGTPDANGVKAKLEIVPSVQHSVNTSSFSEDEIMTDNDSMLFSVSIDFKELFKEEDAFTGSPTVGYWYPYSLYVGSAHLCLMSGSEDVRGRTKIIPMTVDQSFVNLAQYGGGNNNLPCGGFKIDKDHLGPLVFHASIGDIPAGLYTVNLYVGLSASYQQHDGGTVVYYNTHSDVPGSSETPEWEVFSYFMDPREDSFSFGERRIVIAPEHFFGKDAFGTTHNYRNYAHSARAISLLPGQKVTMISSPEGWFIG